MHAENCIVDPGIGFGKTVEHNLELLRHLQQFSGLGVPILVVLREIHVAGYWSRGHRGQGAHGRHRRWPRGRRHREGSRRPGDGHGSEDDRCYRQVKTEVAEGGDLHAG